MITNTMKSGVYEKTVAKMINDAMSKRAGIASGEKVTAKAGKRFPGFDKNFYRVEKDKKAKKNKTEE